MSWSTTASAPSRSSSSLNALPGPLSSMQCRQARLHSFVICQATYSGALRSPLLVAAGVVAGTGAAGAAGEATSILHQTLAPQIGDQRRDLAIDRARIGGRVALLETVADLRLIRPRLDLAQHSGGGRIQRVDLLATRLEQHAAEFLLAKLDVLGETHEKGSLLRGGVGDALVAVDAG